MEGIIKAILCSVNNTLNSIKGILNGHCNSLSYLSNSCFVSLYLQRRTTFLVGWILHEVNLLYLFYFVHRFCFKQIVESVLSWRTLFGFVIRLCFGGCSNGWRISRSRIDDMLLFCVSGAAFSGIINVVLASTRLTSDKKAIPIVFFCNFLKLCLVSFQASKLEAKNIPYQSLHMDFHFEKFHLEWFGGHVCKHMLYNLQSGRFAKFFCHDVSLGAAYMAHCLLRFVYPVFIITIVAEISAILFKDLISHDRLSLL